MLRLASIFFLLLLGAGAADTKEVSTFADIDHPLRDGFVFNIVDWDGDQLPPLYERSDQLPLTWGDVLKLSENNFGTSTIVKMIQERRCACDASVNGLIKLKKAGVEADVVQAVSLHSLPPNRSLRLSISIDFEGLGGAEEISNRARRSYLYLIVPEVQQERVFVGNLGAILGGRWQHDAMVDRTDLLEPKKVRRVMFTADVPLKTYGAKEALVFASAKPDIYTSEDIPGADEPNIRRFRFDYPVSSLRSQCRLNVQFRQDKLLEETWHVVRSHFECDWN